MIWAISCSVALAGSGSVGMKPWALALIVGQASGWSAGRAPPPSQGRRLLALRPAWASCMHTGMGLWRRMCASTRAQRLHLGIVPQAQVVGADAAPRLDGGGFQDQQAGTGLGQLAVVQ